MSELFLIVKMPNGEKWQVPAKFIAEDRAKYYAEHDTKSIEEKEMREQEFNRVYEDEFRESLNSEDKYYNLRDWASNNLNWEDVEHLAKKIIRDTPENSKDDFQEGWVNGEKEVVEKNEASLK